MKKIFTLVAMAAMAIGVNAQTEISDVTNVLIKSKGETGTYDAFKENAIAKVNNVNPNNKGAGTKDAPLAKGTTDAEAFGQATSVTLVDCTVDISTANVDFKIVSTPNANDLDDGKLFDINDKTGNNNALDKEACSPKFNVFVAPKGNPTATYFGYWVKNDAGDASFKTPDAYQTFWTAEAGAAPSKGAYASITVKKAEKLKIGVRIPGNSGSQQVFFVKKSDGTILGIDKYNAEGYINNNTLEYQTFTTNENYNICVGSKQFLGYINVTLPANEEYVLFSPKTQIGIYGFQFGDGASGIESVKAAAELKADAAIYNLAGQKVDAAFKGMVIQNGRKFINK